MISKSLGLTIKCISILLLILFVSSFCVFFLKKPSLLQEISFSKAIFDENQQLLRLTLNKEDKYRLYVPLKKIPSEMIEATLLQEDQYFRKHFGINPIALAHAAYQTYVLHKRRFGASTISMQVARLRFNIHSKTLSGKIVQILRALQLEMHYSKDQILEAYFNLAPYGGNIEGVAAASYIYFHKPIKRLSLPEALTLSLIPQNPSKRTLDEKILQDIRNKLFIRWLKKHPQDQALQSLMQLPLTLHSSRQLPFAAPHFVNALSIYSSHKEIHTSLNMPIQKTLERIATQYIQSKNNLGVHNAAVLLVDTRDMGIKGMLGSVNFFDTKISGQINGTEMRRSPGSTLKPFVYALALDQGIIHPNTVLKDVQRSFGNYNPENFDYDFMGPIKARDALLLSRNIPAIYLSSQLNDENNLYQLLEKASIAHLKSESSYGLALTLGGVEISMRELVSLYAMLVNEGLWRPLRMHEEEALQDGIRLLSPEASFLTLDMLQDKEHLLNKKMPVSWKTGTSSGFRDAWSVGSFGPYVLAVWVGNFDNSSNPAFVGKDIAAPLFFQVIEALKHEALVPDIIKKNPYSMNLVQTEVCKASGLLPTVFCIDREKTWFIPGKSPIKTDNIFREVAINAKTGMRTCHYDEHTQFKIYEFWPSDLLKIFKQAGIARHTPPFFEPGCALHDMDKHISPQISSLQDHVAYLISKQHPVIPLTAVADADVRLIYWFADNGFLGSSSPMQTFYWKANPGKFVIRAVDDHGLSDVKDIEVL